MNIGIFLGIGESLKQMKKSGQKSRFINLYLKKYASNFNKIYLFSYENESCRLPKNVILVPKKSPLHRYLYALLLPIINHKYIKNCDVIRGFGVTSYVPAILLSKPFIFNLPYNYNKFLKIEKKYLLVPIFYVLEKFAFLRAKKVFVATKEKLRPLKGKKFIYLPNGVDLAQFKNIRQLGTGLVYVGRFEKQKNLFFLIDSVSKLSKNFRVITFIGSGSQEVNLKKHALKKKVSLNIIAPVENIILPSYLKKYSIFTLTSLAEGSPKVLLEAMAIGLVPVVTNFSTAHEVITNGQNGFITDYDSSAYSGKLEYLIKNENIYKKMSFAAIQSVVKNFNLAELIAKEIKILKLEAHNCQT